MQKLEGSKGTCELRKKNNKKKICIQQVKGMIVCRVLSLCVSAGEVRV